MYYIKVETKLEFKLNSNCLIFYFNFGAKHESQGDYSNNSHLTTALILYEFL